MAIRYMVGRHDKDVRSLSDLEMEIREIKGREMDGKKDKKGKGTTQQKT